MLETQPGTFAIDRRTTTVEANLCLNREFANTHFPPGDGERETVVARVLTHEVLNIAPEADREVVRAAARQLKKQHHPDAGRDEERFKQVVKAKEAMLD